MSKIFEKTFSFIGCGLFLAVIGYYSVDVLRMAGLAIFNILKNLVLIVKVFIVSFVEGVEAVLSILGVI